MISEEDVDKVLKMSDEMVSHRKMVGNAKNVVMKGVQVIYSDKDKRAYKITPGNIYDILHERTHDQIIRIKDDCGKIIWLTKSFLALV